jgi:hypothetical protein
MIFSQNNQKKSQFSQKKSVSLKKIRFLKSDYLRKVSGFFSNNLIAKNGFFFKKSDIFFRKC